MWESSESISMSIFYVNPGASQVVPEAWLWYALHKIEWFGTREELGYEPNSD